MSDQRPFGLPHGFLIIVFAVFGLAVADDAKAASAKNALGAIAVSPNGKTVLAAGDNRVLYTIDADSLSVKDSLWIGINPLSIHYNKDGSVFIVHDTSNSLVFYSSETKKPIAEVADATLIAIAEKADIIVASGRVKGRDKDATTKLYGYDMSTGKQVVSATAKVGIHGLGVLSDASRIFALSKSLKSEKETKDKVPTELKGLERELFRQKHDGKVSQFVTFEKNGREKGRYTTWYSAATAVELVALGKSILAIVFNNVNAELDRTGKSTKLFKNENRFNYGIGYSIASNQLVTGGLAIGSITNLKDGSSIEFKIDRIGGQSEQFKGFAIAKDGTVYGGTTAYRLVKIGPDSGVEKVAPVF